MPSDQARRYLPWVVGLTIVLGTCVTNSTPRARAQTAATLPPVRAVQQEDVASLAGVWEGQSVIPGSASSPLTMTVKSDGTFIFVGTRATTPGRLWISDGKILYESAFSTGTMTLHEGDGKRVLVWDGVARNGRGATHGEVTQKQPK